MGQSQRFSKEQCATHVRHGASRHCKHTEIATHIGGCIEYYMYKRRNSICMVRKRYTVHMNRQWKWITSKVEWVCSPVAQPIARKCLGERKGWG